MIIYNKTWLSNLLLIKLVEKEYKEGGLSGAELSSIKEKYPVEFYSPNFFIRAGLLILTMIISSNASGLLSFIFQSLEGYGLLILLGIINYISLHVVVRKKHHYNSGVDDALLWTSFGYLVGAYTLAVTLVNIDSYLVFSGFIFLLSLYLTLRFSDMVMSLVSYLACVGILFFAWQKIGTLGISTMPFVFMLFSGLIYWLFVTNLKSSKTLFYANSMIMLQAISLITLYASGNYYVVKELGDMLNKTSTEPIPFGLFFWIWTTILPIGYIYQGLLRKDVISIRVGLILCIAAALTIRNYYHLIPLELVFILSGTFILSISLYLTKYLKTPKHGFFYQDLSNDSLMDQLKIESLIISESSSEFGTPPTDNGTQMGGGKFGGGGASGKF